MPLKDGSLTPQEAIFIGHMAATGDATYSAARAGYRNAPKEGWVKANNPAIAETVRKAQVARLNNDLLPKSLDLLAKVIADDKESTRNRLTAAQVVLKYSLGAKDGAEAKDPHEMTSEEIQARIDDLRRVAADRAKPVLEAKAGPEPSVFE